MKTFQKIALFLFIALSFQSCIPRYVNRRTGEPIYGGQSFGRQGGQMGPGGRSLKPYYPGQKPAGKMITGYEKVQTGTKETKTFKGSFTIQLWNSEDMKIKEAARAATEAYFLENGSFPTDDYVSAKIGHKCHLSNMKAG